VLKRRRHRTAATRAKEEAPQYIGDRRFQFIDLFCGIGGFRIAFERAGCECIWSCDWDKHAQKTYEENFGERPHADIHKIAVADIPAHDILCAGFPCQPFSIAGVSKKLSLGKKHGFEDETQGNLFFEIANIIEYHKPAAFVLENVKHLKRHDNGRTFEIIFDTLTEALGYTVYHKVIDAKAVVPQHRERIFLVGFREWRDFEFPAFPLEGPKLDSILEQNPTAKRIHRKITMRAMVCYFQVGTGIKLSLRFLNAIMVHRAAFQVSIRTGEQSGLPTHIAATESVSSCARMKS
jgi:DNA-cytosine methyltransferase